jgi:MscS family membrane protein
MPGWLKVQVGGIEVWRFLTAFLFILAGFALKKISDHLFQRVIIPVSEKSPSAFDSLLAKAASKPLGYLILLAGFAGCFSALPLPKEPNVEGFLFSSIRVLFAADFLWFLFRVVDVGVMYIGKIASRTKSHLDDQLIPLVRKALKVTVGVVTFLWVVQLLGYNVSSLIAGLGIGGLAVALALQDTLANFFGSIFIFIDRPFAVGDRIKLDTTEGVVEEIGFRSTRIRTLPQTLVSVPNRTIAAATIDNFSRMPKRHVRQIIGVTYETNADRMEQALRAIREILANEDGVDNDLCIVRFTDFGDSSLDILVNYFTTVTAWDDHLAIREKINLAIMRKLDELGLSIAFPTRTLYLEGEVARGMMERTKGERG